MGKIRDKSRNRRKIKKRMTGMKIKINKMTKVSTHNDYNEVLNMPRT